MRMMRAMSYLLLNAQGQPPMERHLVPLSYASCGAVASAADSLSDAISVLGCTVYWPCYNCSFAIGPPSVQVFTFSAESANEQHTMPATSSSAVGIRHRT